MFVECFLLSMAWPLYSWTQSCDLLEITCMIQDWASQYSTVKGWGTHQAPSLPGQAISGCKGRGSQVPNLPSSFHCQLTAAEESCLLYKHKDPEHTKKWPIMALLLVVQAGLKLKSWSSYTHIVPELWRQTGFLGLLASQPRFHCWDQVIYTVSKRLFF